MGTKRDDFLESTKRTLRERVAMRCSSPDCRVPTSAASGDEKVNNLGIAAHIHAASPGGARYDKSMSKDERKSIKNAIWLCSNCSIKIDKDAEQYPVELLRNWKVEAEENALEELGKKLPAKSDAINTLEAAFTGVSKNVLSRSISNIHEANSKILEALDPRFNIKSQYINGCSLIQLHPQEDVPFTMNIKPEVRKEFIDNYKDLVEHGRELTISASSFDVKGSKLIEYLTDSTEDGDLTLLPKKIPAIQKIWLVNRESNSHTYLDDIHGYVVLGTKSFTFVGKALSGILNYRHTYCTNSSSKSDLNFDFAGWEGQSINKIKYFNKLFSFFEGIFEGSQILSLLEVDGQEGLNGLFENPKNIESFQNIYSHLKYIEYSREIASYLNIDLKYTSNVTYTYEQLQYVHDIYKTIKGLNQWSEEDQTANAKSTFCVRNVEEFKKQIMRSEPCEIRIISEEREEVELFGINIILPTKVFLIQSVTIRILNKAKEVIENGDFIDIEYVPSTNYLCSILYENSF